MDGLTAADLANIRAAYALNRDVEQSINRAEACQFDCQDLRERCLHAKRVMDGILETYGPMFSAVKPTTKGQ